MEKQAISVSELNSYLKNVINNDFNLKNIIVKGEISNFKVNNYNYTYFTLKDDTSQIKCLMFRRPDESLALKDGSKVLVYGNVSIYEAYGDYKILVNKIEDLGLGELYLNYLKLKKELAEKGYFSEDRKKPIPKFPKTIGVVTSETGAVIKDIINVTKRRYPFTKILLYPCIVQGDSAKQSIKKAIEDANSQNLCDVLIVGRGGGSFEDLYCFNELDVILAIFNSKIPIISAIGHETDFTISDFVSDKRAPTPSAAAEIATPDKNELKKLFLNYYTHITNYEKQFLFYKRQALLNLDKSIQSLSPKKKINDFKEKLKDLLKLLNYTISNIINNKKQMLKSSQHLLDSLSPFSIFEKGYSLTKCNNKVIKNTKEISINSKITTQLSDGYIISSVEDIKKYE